MEAVVIESETINDADKAYLLKFVSLLRHFSYLSSTFTIPGKGLDPDRTFELVMKTFEKYLMLLSFILAFIGSVGILTGIISIVLWISVLTYLFLGLRVLTLKDNRGKRLLPFVIYYLIASTLVTLIFGINDYPFKIMISYITGSLLIITLILLLLNRRSLSNNYPGNWFLLKVVICFMFAFIPLWTNAIQNV